MRKSPKGFVKWFVGNIKLALTQPFSDRNAKINLALWSLLLLIVLMNVTMALLLGTMSAFLIGLTLVGMIIYTVCLRWAIIGVQYRARLSREAADRQAFDRIVAGL